MLNQLPPPRKRLIGHRGVAGLAPENTLVGFQKAAQIGLNWVEFDVQVCGSGEWIVFHDTNLSRTTNGQGLVAETPWNILKNLDAGSWFQAPQHSYSHTPIPLLEEALDTCLHLGLYPNIEIKMNDQMLTTDHYMDCYQRIRASWPTTQPPPLISSFHIEVLKIFRLIIPKHWPLGYLQPELTSALYNPAIFKCESLHYHYQDLTPALLEEAQKNQQSILIYTLNDFKQIQFLIQDPSNAIFGIFSDMTFINQINHL